MNQATNETTQSAPMANDLSNPELSFADYQSIRRGEKLSESSNPAPEKSEQKKSLDSGTEEKEVIKAKDESEDESDTDGDDDSKDLENDKPKKKGGFQRRIDKLNARYAAAQQETEHWKQQALKSASESKSEPVESSKSVSVEGKPDPEKYDTHAEYVEALTDWKIEQRESALKAAAQKSQLQSEQEKVAKAHFDREKSFADKTDDYKEVITDLLDSKPNISATFEQLIVSSDNGPEIMYILAKDVKEFERINSLPPLAAAREIGKIEYKLASVTSEPKQESKKITTAPKPLEPVGKSSSGSIRKSITDPEIPFSDYVRLRREQMKRR